MDLDQGDVVLLQGMKLNAGRALLPGLARPNRFAKHRPNVGVGVKANNEGPPVTNAGGAYTNGHMES